MSREIPIIYADDPNFERLMKEGKIASGVDDWLHHRGKDGFNKRVPPEKKDDRVQIPSNKKW
jgi:hypothetical protein